MRKDQTDGVARVPRRRFSGEEHLGETGRTILDYWRWSCDLLENIQRGIFAEYIVAAALGATKNARTGWRGYDMLYGESKIEVKSSSYLQSWKQKVLSRPVFQIAREQLDEETGTYADPRYVADAFVLCLFTHRDPGTADILDLNQWLFLVANTETLKRYFPGAKPLSESRLRALTTAVNFCWPS